MKISRMFLILIALVSIPSAIYAQGGAGAKHAINTKGAGANDVVLNPCPPVEQSVITAAQERQKTKTKSNNPNDRTAAPAVRILQGGCAEVMAVDAGQALTFVWKKMPEWTRPSFDGKDLHLTIWEVSEGQTIGDAIADPNRRSFQKAIGFVDRFDMDNAESARILRRPRDVSTSFIWELQPLDSTGKATGSALRGGWDLEANKKK